MIFSKIIQYEYLKFKENTNNNNNHNNNKFVNVYNPLTYFICNFDNQFNKYEKDTFYMKYKFFILKNFIANENILLSERAIILELFCKCQRTYFALIKFKNIFLNKTTSIYDNKHDLSYNELDSIKYIHKISIIDNKKKYILTIFDLIRIINNALSYTINLFSQPVQIKNPFTNIPFTYCQLYNIYFYIKQSNINMPLLFERFFISNFNLNDYQNNNEILIREYIIKHYYLFDESQLLRYIKSMIHEYNTNIACNTHPIILLPTGFPAKELLRVFMPLLKFFINSILSHEPMIQIKNKFILIKKLKQFVSNNPFFGRSIRCMNIRKIYYICVLHHMYNITFQYLYSNFYIPQPLLINVKQKTYWVSENTRNNLHCSFFPDIKYMFHTNNIIEKTPNVNIIDIIKFARTYDFSVGEHSIIQDHIHCMYNVLMAADIVSYDSIDESTTDSIDDEPDNSSEYDSGNDVGGDNTYYNNIIIIADDEYDDDDEDEDEDEDE